MKMKSLLLALGLVAATWPFAYARPIKEKLTTPVHQEDGAKIAVELKSVGASASVQGSTVVAGQDIRRYVVRNPDPVYELYVSSGPLGNLETSYAVGVATHPSSILELHGNTTFYMKMQTGSGTNVIRILRQYDDGK